MTALSNKEQSNKNTATESSVFMNILQGKTQHRPAVWLMRQAGRSLQAYMALKEKYHFHQIMRTPELAAEVTLQPVAHHEVDAAIIFSDILVVIEALGIEVDYTRAKPCITTPLQKNPKLLTKLIARLAKGSEEISEKDSEEKMELQQQYFLQTANAIHAVKVRSNIPLIGFCGGPLTVLCYLFEGMGGNFPQLRKFFYTNPQEANLLLKLITKASIAYAKAQIDAGINAFQIFETWATAIPTSMYFSLVFPHVQHIANSLKAYAPVPLIYFPKGMGSALHLIPAQQFAAVSVDHYTPLTHAAATLKGMAVQGNLDPYLPLALAGKTLEKAVLQQLQFFKQHPHWIVNLGHGVLPNTPQDNIRTLVQTVKNFSG